MSRIIDKSLVPEWPAIYVDDIEHMIKYYVDILGFEVLNRNDAEKQATLRLDQFQLIMLEQLIKRQDTSNRETSNPQGEQTVLYIPVAKPALYGRQICSRGGKPFTGLRCGTDFLDHNCEAFYYRDPEGHVLCFWLDWHGPYSGNHWHWNEEVLPKEESITDYERTFKNNLYERERPGYSGALGCAIVMVILIILVSLLCKLFGIISQ